MGAESNQFKLVRVPSLKTVARFREHASSLGINIPCDDTLVLGNESPLRQSLPGVEINGKTIGNRWAIHPMEGWDCLLYTSPSPRD